MLVSGIEDIADILEFDLEYVRNIEEKITSLV